MTVNNFYGLFTKQEIAAILAENFPNPIVFDGFSLDDHSDMLAKIRERIGNPLSMTISPMGHDKFWMRYNNLGARWAKHDGVYYFKRIEDAVMAKLCS